MLTRFAGIALLLCTLFSLSACTKNIDKGNETTQITTNEVTTIEVYTTEATTGQAIKEDEGIVQPSKNPDGFFAGTVEISTFAQPDENGYYIVEESQWTLDIKKKSLDEEVESRKKEIAQLGVELIQTSTDTDASAAFVFDEENYYKMVSIVENTANDRVGLYGNKISISKDFGEVIMYVDENTKLEDFYTRVSFMYWSVFQCQAYSAIKAEDIHITLKVANTNTEEILIELNLDNNTSIDISEEEWVEILQ